MVKSRKAECLCGQLSIVHTGEMKGTSICHCTACQKRTGSVYGVQVGVKKLECEVRGKSKQYGFVTDSGDTVTLHSCPTCSTTLFWEIPYFKDDYVIAAGCFADQSLPAPVFSCYEERMHHWVELPDTVLEHMD